MSSGWDEEVGSSTFIVVSPHFDDAVLSTFGLLAHAHSCKVINVFTHVPSGIQATDWDRDRGFSSAQDHMTARLAEERDVMASLRVDHQEVDLVPFEYVQSREQLTADERLAVLDAISLEWSASGVRPTVALPVGAGRKYSIPERVYHRLWPARRPPGGGAAHIDHVALTDSLLPELLRLEIPVVLYEDLPYLWSGPGDQRCNTIIRGNGLSAQPRTISIDPESKADAVRHYASQLSALVQVPAETIQDVLPKTERFWELSPL